MTEGWLCPRCKKVNAPWVPQCTCGEDQNSTTNIAELSKKNPSIAWPDQWWGSTTTTVTNKASSPSVQLDTITTADSV